MFLNLANDEKLREPATENCANLLNSLRFVSQKKTLYSEDTIYNKLMANEAYKDPLKVCKIITTNSNASTKSKASTENSFSYEKTFKIRQNDFYYNFNAWHRLAEQIRLELSNKPSENILEEVYRNYFKISNQNAFAHHSRRKTYSLDAILGGSGKKFRVLRKNELKHKIYQLHVSDKVNEVGLKILDNNNLDIKETALPATINKSNKSVEVIEKDNSKINKTYKYHGAIFYKGQEFIFNQNERDNILAQLNNFKYIESIEYKFSGDTRRWDIKVKFDKEKLFQNIFNNIHENFQVFIKGELKRENFMSLFSELKEILPPPANDRFKYTIKENGNYINLQLRARLDQKLIKYLLNEINKK